MWKRTWKTLNVEKYVEKNLEKDMEKNLEKDMEKTKCGKGLGKH